MLIVIAVPLISSNSRHMDMVKVNTMADYHSLPLTSWKIKQPSADEVRDEALATGTWSLM